jgi:hypothetical protein
MLDMLSKGRDKHRATIPGKWGQKHPMAKISDEQAKNIRVRASSGELLKDLACEYGLSSGYVSRMCLGKKRVHG